MSETTENTETTTPAFPVDLRALIAARTETKVRRIHKQWFCFNPQVAADLADAERALADLVTAEAMRRQAQQKPSVKYSMPTPIQEAEARYTELKARHLQVGATGVFMNLNDDKLTEVAGAKRGGDERARAFGLAKDTLLAAFLRWEDADGAEIPADVLGRDDLEMLLDPEILERGEFLPLATLIMNESQSVISRPTWPAR